MFPKEIVLVEVELSSYTEKLLTATGGRTDRQTDRQTDTVLKGRSLSKGLATCFSSIPAKKKACGADCMSKIRQNRSETLIAVPGSTVTYSRLNQNYNICAFTQEIQVFEADIL